MQPMLNYAIAANDAGLCVLPPKGNGSKAPVVSWARFQHNRSTSAQINAWYSDGTRTGLGAVLGAVSGNIELLEFDDVATYEEFKIVAKEAGNGDLIDAIEKGYCEETPNGIHWLYRCDVVEPNTKLAQRPSEDKTVNVLIETRGEGGYVVLAPSHGNVHPSGKPYKMRSGGFHTIATITAIERERLFSLARSFDEMPRVEHSMQLVDERKPGEAERPGDYYNRTRTWGDVLEPHGWRSQFTRGHETYWTRPGRERVTSATTNYADTDLLKVFSTSTTFATDRTYTKFGAYAHLNHEGSFADAARAIRAEMKPEPWIKTPDTSVVRDLVANDLLGPGQIATAAQSEAMMSQITEAVESPEYERLKNRLLSTEELLNLPPPEWLVEGYLVENSLAVIWGAPGSFKSFLALDWALSLAVGQWWNGKAIKAAHDVLYVAAEGTAGIPKRVRAWSKHNKVAALSRAHWLPETVDILDDRQFDALCRIVAETHPAFIVVDTLARSIPGADENAAQDMGRAIQRADLLKQISGGTVVLVHHSTKEGSTARGSGALRGAVDTEIEVKLTGETQTTIYCRKQKDGPPFAALALNLVAVPMSDSCILSVSFDDETFGASSHGQETARRIYRETFSETPPTKAELRNVLMEKVPCVYGHAYRLINFLVRDNFLEVMGGKLAKGSEYYDPYSSHNLLGVSSSNETLAPESHRSRGPIGPEHETSPKTDAEQSELWGE